MSAHVATEMPCRERASGAAQRLLAALLSEVDAGVAQARVRATPARIHLLRVAAARFAVALRLFDAPAGLERAVAHLRSRLGACRDRQNRLAWLAAGETPAAPWLVAGERRELKRRLRRQRAALLRWSERSPRWPALLRRLELRGRYGGHRLRRRHARRVRAVADEAARLRRQPKRRALHALRLDVKELRYSTELLAPALDEALAAALPGLARVQSALGELHDDGLRLAWLRALERSSSTAAQRATLAALRARAAEESERHAAKVPALLRRCRKLAQRLGAGQPARQQQRQHAAALGGPIAPDIESETDFILADTNGCTSADPSPVRAIHRWSAR